MVSVALGFKGENLLETLKKIAFERVGGTPKEREALEIIAEEVRKRGIQPFFEPFKVRTFNAGEGKVELLTEPPAEFRANPVGLTGSCEVTGRARYVEPANLGNIDAAKGEIILLPRIISIGYKTIIAVEL